MDALIIKKPWVDYILSGQKCWEIRGCSTKKRGTIELIQSKSGLVVGKCELIDCVKLDLGAYRHSIDKHFIKDVEILPYKSTFAWVLANPIRYEKPRPYKHPNGAVIWVKL